MNEELPRRRCHYTLTTNWGGVKESSFEMLPAVLVTWDFNSKSRYFGVSVSFLFWDFDIWWYTL